MAGDGGAGGGGGGDVDAGYYDADVENHGFTPNETYQEGSEEDKSIGGAIIGGILGGIAGLVLGGGNPGTAISGAATGAKAGYNYGGSIVGWFEGDNGGTTEGALESNTSEGDKGVGGGAETPSDVGNVDGVIANVLNESGSSGKNTSVGGNTTSLLEDLDSLRKESIEELRKRRKLIRKTLLGTEGILSPAPVATKTILG